MKIWIVTVGEPLPLDGPNVRLYRSGILANLLMRQGHDVTWWSSTFDHIARSQRIYRSEEAAQNHNLRLFSTPGYRKSIGLARMWSHAVSAINFARFAELAQKPGVILASYPTIELCHAAVRLGRKHGIPVVIDIRDLWPDIFTSVFPPPLKFAAPLALLPYHRIARTALKGATAIVGVTDEFVEWGYRKSGRVPDANAKSFAMGYEAVTLTTDQEAEARRFWDAQGLHASDWIVCFFGTLGRQFQFDSVFEAASILERSSPGIKFVICGDGDFAKDYKAKAKGLSNVLFPGWVDKNQIHVLMSISRIGLAPYIESQNFLLNMPNKPIEYLSKGLPILSTIGGHLGKTIEENAVGIVCDGGDPCCMAGELADLRRDPHRWHQMSAASKALFDRRYRAEAVYTEFSDYLQRVADAYKPQQPERRIAPKAQV